MKENIKLSLFADDIIVYVERINKKLLELKTDYSKIAEYKVNVQKSIAFLYTSNEQVGFTIKNTIPFALAPKKKRSALV